MHSLIDMSAPDILIYKVIMKKVKLSLEKNVMRLKTTNLKEILACVVIGEVSIKTG